MRTCIADHTRCITDAIPTVARRVVLAVLGTICVACFAFGCRASDDVQEQKIKKVSSFTLSVAWGREGAARAELHVRPSDSVWRLRVRTADAGSWPARFDCTFVMELPVEQVLQLATALEGADFFTLPDVIEGDGTAVAPITIRVRQFGRVHRVVAQGRSLPPFAKAMQLVDRLCPVELPAAPDWMEPFEPRKDTRPKLVPDARAAVLMHREWVQQEPENRALLVDLFALYLAAKQPELAASLLSGLERDSELAGLVPELRKLLGER